jgi:hypothetical protein
MSVVRRCFISIVSLLFFHCAYTCLDNSLYAFRLVSSGTDFAEMRVSFSGGSKGILLQDSLLPCPAFLLGRAMWKFPMFVILLMNMIRLHWVVVDCSPDAASKLIANAPAQPPADAEMNATTAQDGSQPRTTSMASANMMMNETKNAAMVLMVSPPEIAFNSFGGAPCPGREGT